MDLVYSLPQNILQKIIYIHQDFIGFKIDITVFRIFLICLTFAVLITFLSYSLGKKIYSLVEDKKETNYDYLFSIGIGYILIGSGIAILGFFSLLNYFSINLLLFCIVIYSFSFPFSLKENFFCLLYHVRNDFEYLIQNKFVFIWVLFFISIAAINLINPEVREDQYHTDLPIIYLQNHTVLIPPREGIGVSASPLLSEMYYIPGILYISPESARYIHFIFYILVLLTLINFSKLKKYKFAIYTPLLFSSSPVVIHETSSMYVDFQWIFCFLLSILMLLDRKNNKYAIIKSGLLFGGMLATKLWTIVFSTTSLLYLLIDRKNVNKKILNLIIFLSTALLVSGIWYLRAYLLTGNPLYPAFGNITNINSISFFDSLSHFVGINYQLLNIFSFINVFSPIFFLSFIFLGYKLKKNIKQIIKMDIFRYLVILFLLYLSIHYPFGRYLLGLYVIFIFLASLAIENVYRKFKVVKILFNFILMILASYYLFSYLLILPYTLGISDKNRYLSRILIRDNSSYYDFDHKFDKYISAKDNVAMYNFHGYYYTNFNYKDVYFIYDKNQKSLNLLKQKKYTKLLIRSGDIKWFCNKMQLANCDTSKFSLISQYLIFPSYYLYDIN